MSSVSLELTPDSKRILREWTKDKTGEIDKVINRWLISMQSWMLKETMRAFDTGKQPGGSAWPPNVGRYKEWKASIGSHKPGILHGSLRKSFAQNKAINKAKNEAKIGSTEKHAAFMFYGTSSGARGLYVKGPKSTRGFFNFSRGVRARPYFPTVQHGERHATQLFNDLIKRHLA